MDEKQTYSVDEILAQAKDDLHTDNAFDEDAVEQPEAEPQTEEKSGWFGKKKKKKKTDFDEAEAMYYGVQVRPLDEFRRGFDATGEIKMEDDSFARLFDDTIPSLDEEVERNFQRIQRERRRRVAEAVESAGVNLDDMANELGVVAPMPVTSFSADPYAKENGIDGDAQNQGDNFQKAMRQTAESQTMEIKLNVLNDTVELQKSRNMPEVDEDTVNRILENAEAEAEVEANTPWERRDDTQEIRTKMEGALQRMDKKRRESLPLPVASQKQAQPQKKPQAEGQPPAAQVADMAEKEQTKVLPKMSEKIEATQNTIMYLDIPQEPMAEFPLLEDPQQFRDKTVPVHIINIDVLQSVIITESAQQGKKERREKGESPFRRFAAKLQNREEVDEDSTESIDDYTSQADARSVSHELAGGMRQISMRLLITGLSTVILFIASLILDKTPAKAVETDSPIVYLIINLVLVLLCAGFSYKSLLGGLAGVIKFHANSDSGVAIAAVAVLAQVTLGFVFRDSVNMGGAHLYGLIICFLLFMNALGKLTMLRRIHSNFRFVTSREQKYAVRLYGDYNTALRLAKDCVAGAPVIAYQKKAGFLKRFLQLSNEPDPAEQVSQNLAPIGLVASLLLFVIAMLITQSFYLGLTAFAAASCILVAAGNMLAVNLPISKLCKRARRAGAMMVGYSAVAQMAGVNAIMMDAVDLFPSGTVVLDGVKTFGSGNKESAILAATALTQAVGGTLADVFNQVNSDTEETLPRVSNLSLEDEHGVTGSVDGHKVLVGSRTLLMNHHIEPPERDAVTKYTGVGKKVVFVAVDGILQAMLVMSYKADKRKKNELQRMEENGVSLIVRAIDANITQNMIGKLFDISPSSIRVITGELGETYEELVQEEVARADALVATKGRVESMMAMITACISERRMVAMVTALQTISVVLGFVLVAFLSCFSGIGQLSAVALLLYELFWVLVLVFLPKIKKP